MNKFIRVESEDPHLARRKAIWARHGNVIREWMRPNPWSFGLVLALTGLQVFFAYRMRDVSAWWLVPMVYFVGAFLNHALGILIHEASHNLIFRTTFANRVAAMICDWVLVVPSAMAFRKYHLLHHTKMGVHDWDADICSEREASWVGTSPWRKLVWIFGLGVSQALRPLRLKGRLWDGWVFANLISQTLVLILLFQFVGWQGLVYLFASTFVALGLHPLGGRWLAEHYVTRTGQETYSYYGPLSWIALNVGHHNEHHDFMNIPWTRLPHLRRLGGADYEGLFSYSSYSGLLWTFITNQELTLFSRVLRPEKVITKRSDLFSRRWGRVGALLGEGRPGYVPMPHDPVTNEQELSNRL